MKPVFRQIRLIRCVYELLRCLHLEIWQFLCPQTGRTHRLLYPLLRMRARRVMMSVCVCVWPWITELIMVN
jgi:hypothetical protein